MSVRSASFVFTINNYNEEDVKKLRGLPEPWRVLFGKEVGAKGTPHLQGVIWREDEVRFRRNQAEKLLGGRAYLSPVKEWSNSLGYCVKEGDWLCNYATKEEIKRVQEVVKDAQSISDQHRWLGSVLENCLNYPDYPCTHDDLLVYFSHHQ